MSIQFLERRREIEGLYKKLKIIREQINFLINGHSEYATPDNIGLLELEEESILTRIVKLKNFA